jgi:hypothetical protein
MSCRRMLPENLTVHHQLAKKFITFMQPEVPLPSSQEPVTGSYPKLNECNSISVRPTLLLSPHLSLGL